MAVDQDRLVDFLHRLSVTSGRRSPPAAWWWETGSESTARWPSSRCSPRAGGEDGTAPRYVEEWLRGQAAGGYVQHDPATASTR